MEKTPFSKSSSRNLTASKKTYFRKDMDLLKSSGKNERSVEARKRRTATNFVGLKGENFVICTLHVKLLR
jgi:hypothetical protein